MTTDQIILHEVFFHYKGSRLLLENLSLKITKGEIIGILGPNGGGKSTLLKLLLGLLKPIKGSISLFNNSPKNFRPLSGYVPQHASFDKDFPISVQEVMLMSRLSHLKWHGRYSDEDKKIVDWALDVTGMLSYKDMSFSHLSGGQAQRTLIARALASEPALLILDEPTANVDLENQKKIYDILEALKKRITIIMVTHDLHHAMKLFDRAFYLNLHLQPLKTENLCQKSLCEPEELKHPNP
ncbi:MAG: ABC transporter ATP-binding protein [Victivallaceae bacterium]